MPPPRTKNHKSAASRTSTRADNPKKESRRHRSRVIAQYCYAGEQPKNPRNQRGSCLSGEVARPVLDRLLQVLSHHFVYAFGNGASTEMQENCKTKPRATAKGSARADGTMYASQTGLLARAFYFFAPLLPLHVLAHIDMPHTFKTRTDSKEYTACATLMHPPLATGESDPKHGTKLRSATNERVVKVYVLKPNGSTVEIAAKSRRIREIQREEGVRVWENRLRGQIMETLRELKGRGICKAAGR